ncbi:hypothetical protein chiPu_0024695 [Chiloscyllium punctatum]|uniref:Uncharacterized protein n=1 Tax=Chiloscyllium punctatum TaxID=137246 RepID=A0A401TDI2_CHIPU|nr:hypothetical protein [Chiloscyllium punctatum]
MNYTPLRWRMKLLAASAQLLSTASASPPPPAQPRLPPALAEQELQPRLPPALAEQELQPRLPPALAEQELQPSPPSVTHHSHQAVRGIYNAETEPGLFFRPKRRFFCSSDAA